MTQDFCDQHQESLRLLTTLNLSDFLPQESQLLVDLQNSSGPFLRLCDDRDVFDVRKLGPPPIGYNASPLFGALHRLENWLCNSTATGNEAGSLRNSYQQFRSRMGWEPLSDKQSAAAINRDYIGSVIGVQYSDQAQLLAERIGPELIEIEERFAKLVAVKTISNLTFAITPVDQATRKRLLESRLRYGLLFDIRGQEFQLSLHLGFRSNHLDMFWNQIRYWLDSARPQDISSNNSKAIGNYQFHRQFLEQKFAELTCPENPQPSNAMTADSYLKGELARTLPNINFDIQILTQESYPNYRQQILDMQFEVYEPARQTPPEEFDALFDKDKLRFQGDPSIQRPPLAIVVLENERIVSMAFAGPLDMFTCERGVSTDPYLEHPTTYYMLDLTVIESYRGKLGRPMKNAITLLASQTGIHAIHGRNRDRLARGMWAINISLGSYELQHLPDDYPDNNQFRDCIYYRCPLRWKFREETVCWSQGNRSPLNQLKLPDQFFTENMAVIVNGGGESNTVSFKFIQELKFLASLWPTELRHILATCRPTSAGQQIVDALNRRSRSADPQNSTIIFIQSCTQQFPESCKTIAIANPSSSGQVQFLEQLRATLKARSDNCTAIVIEPITSDSFDRLSSELLKEVLEIGQDYHVPVVFIESASLLYRYGSEFAASCEEGLQPDLVIAQLGNSMSVLLGRKEFLPNRFFHGGEPISLFGFNELLRQIRRNPAKYQETLADFDQAIHSIVDKHAERFQVKKGVGWIEGNIPAHLSILLEQNEHGRYLLCPTYGQMQRMDQTFAAQR